MPPRITIPEGMKYEEAVEAVVKHFYGEQVLFLVTAANDPANLTHVYNGTLDLVSQMADNTSDFLGNQNRETYCPVHGDPEKYEAMMMTLNAIWEDRDRILVALDQQGLPLNPIEKRIVEAMAASTTEQGDIVVTPAIVELFLIGVRAANSMLDAVADSFIDSVVKDFATKLQSDPHPNAEGN